MQIDDIIYFCTFIPHSTDRCRDIKSREKKIRNRVQRVPPPRKTGSFFQSQTRIRVILTSIYHSLSIFLSSALFLFLRIVFFIYICPIVYLSIYLVNMTSITLHLYGWEDGGCPIVYFVIEYREHHQNTWRVVSSNIR